jgi:hypothetical protein
MAAAKPAAALRCGWLENVTPGNFSLVDRDAEWTIAEQGGYEAPGFDRLPDMSTHGWIETNGPHGHGCACLTVETDRTTRRVTNLLAGRPVALARCRADRRLPRR